MISSVILSAFCRLTMSLTFIGTRLSTKKEQKYSYMNTAVFPSREMRRKFTTPLTPLLHTHPPDPAGKKDELVKMYTSNYNIEER